MEGLVRLLCGYQASPGGKPGFVKCLGNDPRAGGGEGEGGLGATLQQFCLV